MDFVEAAAAAQIAPGTMLAVDVGGNKLRVANVDGIFHAMRRNCPHMGADLGKSTLDGRVVTCRLHEAAFDVTIGKETRHLKMLPRELVSFPVEVCDGKMVVRSAVGPSLCPE